MEILDQFRTKFEERGITLVVCHPDHLEPRGGIYEPYLLYLTMQYHCLPCSWLWYKLCHKAELGKVYLCARRREFKVSTLICIVLKYVYRMM